MGWRRAEASKQSEEMAKKRILEAESKVKQLESEKSKAWKTREKKKSVYLSANSRAVENHMQIFDMPCR
jgi:hypothetical protein